MSYELADILEEKTLEQIGNLDSISLKNYAEVNHIVLNVLYKNGILQDDKLKLALEKIVINTAKMDYNILIKNGNYADHAYSPECFAYAIQKKIFSDKELKKIKFDHGETLESFPKEYSDKNLIGNLKRQLLSPRPISKSKSHCDEHCTCC